jgi:hypothetical protein
LTSIYFISFKTFSCLSRVKTLELLGVVKLEMAVLVHVVVAVLWGDVVLAPIVVVAIVVNTTDVTVYVVSGGCCCCHS